MASPAKVVLLFVIILVFVWGTYDYLENQEKNGCEMTYMYTQPEYIQVPLDATIQLSFPRYSLYFYGEGSYARKNQNLELSGIPVLFIPGNAGSHRQVRSLGSVALKRAADSKTKFHFNYFALDFNEEMSGLYGGVLKDQTEFAARCIDRILSLYKKAASVPHSVVLVGHSMGGLVARALFTLPHFDVSLVHTIITQATPHQAPVSAIDSYITQFYDEVNSFWKREKNGSLSDVTVFSTGGGFRDTIVPSRLTSLNQLVAADRGLSTNTMAVPLCWASTDHLCHVWCKQIVLATTRALFDIVDRKSKQVAVNPLYRWRVFHHHFVHNPGSKKVVFTADKTVELDRAVKWEVRQKTSWSVNRDSMEQPRHSVIQLTDTEDMALVAVTNLAGQAWIGGCNLPPHLTHCAQLENWAPRADLLPPLYSDKKVVHLTTGDLQSSSHIVTVLPQSKSPVRAQVEVYNVTERHVEWQVTSLMDMVRGFPGSVMKEELVVEETQPGAVFYNITLQGLHIPLQAYTLHLTPLNCSTPPTGGFAGCTAKLYIPWSNEHTYSHARAGRPLSVSARLQSGRPDGASSEPELHLYLHPTCLYRLSITTSYTELYGQFVRFYGLYLPNFLAIQVLMALSWQLQSLDETGEVPFFTVAHTRWAQPWRVVPAAMLVHFLTTYPEENNIGTQLGLPEDDVTALQRAGVWYPALPVMLYLVSYAFMSIMPSIMAAVLGLLGKLLGALCFRCCAGLSTHAVRLQYVVFLFSAVLAFTTCGAVAILLVCIVYYAKVIGHYCKLSRTAGKDRTQLNKEVDRTQLSKEVDGSQTSKELVNQCHMDFSLLLLLLFLLLLNAPPLIIWTKNLQHGLALAEDPSMGPALVSILSAVLLSFFNFSLTKEPANNTIHEGYTVLGLLSYVTCVLMVLYSFASLYRVSYFLSSCLLLLALSAPFISRRN